MQTDTNNYALKNKNTFPDPGDPETKRSAKI